MPRIYQVNPGENCVHTGIYLTLEGSPAHKRATWVLGVPATVSHAADTCGLTCHEQRGQRDR